MSEQIVSSDAPASLDGQPKQPEVYTISDSSGDERYVIYIHLGRL
jgi:hypothetical protein